MEGLLKIFAVGPQKTRRFVVTLILISGLVTTCTRKSGSNIRDTESATPFTAADIGPMEVKFTFRYPGLGGTVYPIHMSAHFAPHTDPRNAVWNSVIVSDGGLLKAQSEAKTIKPDSNLSLGLVASQALDSAQFTSGNPEIGRGLSVTFQKVKVNGSIVWKAVQLSYFGYKADIEDSRPVIK